MTMDDGVNNVNIIARGEEDVDTMEEESREEEGGVFMFDCIKAYNDSIEKKRSQEVLRCKMTDKADGDDVFIVVDKSALAAKP